jgi:hypothetical protein
MIAPEAAARVAIYYKPVVKTTGFRQRDMGQNNEQQRHFDE